jgi:replicative DNA helicase
VNYEVSLLNAVIDTGDIAHCIDNDCGDFFYDNKDVWDFVVDFYHKYQKAPSKITIQENFKDFPLVKVEEHLDYYIDQAREKCIEYEIKSLVRQAGDILRESGAGPALNFFVQKTNSLMKVSGRVKDVDIASDYMARVNDLRDRVGGKNKGHLGIPSGITVIDHHFGGWQKGDLVVILGWTGVGKSFMGLMFAINAWLHGYRPLYISLEMDRQQVEYRVDTILNGGKYFRNSELVHARNINPDDYESWVKNTFDGKHPFYLVTSNGMDQPNQHMIQSKIDQYSPDLVILDYHGLFEDASGAVSEVERTKNLSKAFKRLALKNEVPVIDIAAVTMPAGQHNSRAPELSEVAWSKQIAYDADLVLGVNRRPDSNLFEVISRKVRRGQPFAFYLEWDLDSGAMKEVFEPPTNLEDDDF